MRVTTCGADGCAEQVNGGYCSRHRSNRRSPSGQLTGSAAWKRVRRQVLDRDRWTCHYCGKRATTADHKDPVSRGGAKLDPANLVAACVGCNSSKQDRIDTDLSKH